MTTPNSQANSPLLLLVAGAKGAIASTLAVAITASRNAPETILPSLTTRNMFPYLGAIDRTLMAGWDSDPQTMASAARCQGILPDSLCQLHADALDNIMLKAAPPAEMSLSDQVESLMSDIQQFRANAPKAIPIFINLLPAAPIVDLSHCHEMTELYKTADGQSFPDLAYALAAVLSGVPIVNFTPNDIEIPVVINEAVKCGIPMCGRDGKTGQTYLKVVLASALKARSFTVDGWYSLNILGNADGMNLMEPDRAAGKMANKTDLLDEILGYNVGHEYDTPTHKVHIDYYPPRGDAKEAWDVIDFKGLFNLPMSIRINLQGRDSILAAPMTLDLSRWMAALKLAGISGPIADLGFFFKKPIGNLPPKTFQEQLNSLAKLEQQCDKKIASTDTL
jgi:myo-inositol-1-phosphate synthase